MRLGLTFFISFLFFACMAQKDTFEEDYLKRIATAKHDSNACWLYTALAGHYATINREKGIFYAQKAVELAKKLKHARLLGTAYERIADSYWYAYNNQQAIKFYLLEKRVADSCNNIDLKARSLYNIGWIKCLQQKEANQFHYLSDAYAIFRQLKDTAYILNSLDAIGSYYKDFNKDGLYNDSVIKYYLGALRLIEISRYKRNESTCNNNLGEFYKSIDKHQLSLTYFNKALVAAEKQKDTFSILISKRSQATAYYFLDSTEKSLALLLQIKPFIEKDVQQEENKKGLYEMLYLIYKKKKNYPEALMYHEKYKTVSDTLNLNIFKSDLKAQENNYQNELNEKTITDLKQRNELSDLRIKNGRILIYALGGIVLLIGFILILLFRNIKQNKKTNALLSSQNKEISQKKEEIEQSIQYARGIQSGILPEKEVLNQIVPENFIYYLPKDIVSGDFYWFHRLEDSLLLAAADCTGHGVPGALMSVVSIDRLNQAVFELQLREPESILKAINISVKEALKQNTAANTQKDGLDIALIHYKPQVRQLLYAGANRPLWLIRKGELIEYKPTKAAIAGHSSDEQHYPQNELKLEKDDLIFLFSDGYPDQFGGAEGKKLMTKNFKELLLKNCHSSLSEIQQIVQTHFEQWKKGFEQVDDVLVIGLKI